MTKLELSCISPCIKFPLLCVGVGNGRLSVGSSEVQQLACALKHASPSQAWESPKAKAIDLPE